MSYPCWLLWLFMFLFLHASNAQSLGSSRHFTEDDGLSSSKVTSLLYDQEGFLWVGTDYGLNRFNGIHFTTFLPVQSDTAYSAPGNEYITSLAQTKSGRIWIGTQNGLYYYDSFTKKFMPFPALRNKGIHSMVVKEERLILTTTEWEGYVLDSKKLSAQRFESFCKFTDVLPKKFKSITLGTTSENIYVESSEGYMFLNLKGKMDKVPVKNHDWKYLLMCGIEYCFDVIPTYDQDILYFERGESYLKKMPLPLPHTLIGGFRTVHKILERTFLGDVVLTQQGLFLGDLWEHSIWKPDWSKNSDLSVPHGPLYCGVYGKEKQVWIGGANGLWFLEEQRKPFSELLIDPSPTTSFDNRYGASVYLMEHDLQLVADVYLGDLLLIRGNKVIKRLHPGPITGIVHRDILGKVWVSGGSRLYEFDPLSMTLVPINIPSEIFNDQSKSAFFYMADDGQGNYWFQSNNQGILHFNASTKQWDVPQKLRDKALKALSSIYYDSKAKVLWIGTEKNGLYRYHTKNDDLVSFNQEDTGRKNVYGIARDSFDRIWAVYYPGGLVAFDGNGPVNKVLKTIGTQDGLPSNACTSILTDNDGDLWIGTSRGLALVLVKDLQVLHWEAKSGLKTTFLDMPLVHWGMNDMAVGGRQTITIWDPNHFKQNILPGKLLLENILVNDQKRNLKEGFTLYLQPGEKSFNVQFGTTSFERPSMNTYQSRLLGYQDEWVECNQPGIASWSNLPPGKYQLEIRQLYQSMVQPYKLTFNVIVIPYFYQTNWFYVLVGFLVSGIIFLIYWLRVRNIRKEAQLKTAFHQQLAKVEMSALRAQMNPHFVFNSLNSINRFILLNETDTASTYLTKFSRLIRMILDHSRSEAISLEQELHALQLYIELEAIRFDNKFTYSIKVDELIKPSSIEVPPLLIQPFVENAIWHGLMHKRDQGELMVHVSQQEQDLIIVIEDNGVGRTMAAELKSKSALEHKSHGMQVTHDRLSILQGRFGGKSSIEVKDLLYPDGHSAGTQVIVKLALQ